jgi:AraC family transcriptional regulator
MTNGSPVDGGVPLRMSARQAAATTMQDQYVRSVGGDVLSSLVTETACIRIETIRRRSVGKLHWHFRQPELSLFWFGIGAERLNARVDGRHISCDFPGRSRLCIFPSGTEIEGEWNAGPTADYTVVFLDPSFVASRLGADVCRPTIGFHHDGLSRGLAELQREAACPDGVFNLMAEGWAIQALAQIARVSRGYHAGQAKVQGGLSARCERMLDEHIRSSLARDIAVEELARLAGLSERHLLRAFQRSFGSTPHQYVLARRIDQAKDRLQRSDDSVTEIALAVGFGQAEHFATTFKRMTGFTPSGFRRRCAS